MTEPTKQATTPNTDDAPAFLVLSEVLRCAVAWEPHARILGNVRAGDIERAIAEWDAAMRKALGLIDGHMGDTDPQDHDHPLLVACQTLARALSNG